VTETRATLRYSGTSPTKVRQVLNLIRGLDVSEAREVLRFCERGAADEVAKLLDSAVANAEHNDSLPSDELYVSRAWADEGPTMKRYRPRARGRGTRIRKRTSHVTVVVSRYTEEALLARTERETASGTGAAADRRRRLTRRRRVAASTAAAERHDHDHDHDDEEAADETELVDATEAPEASDVDVAEADAPEVEAAAEEAELEGADETAAEDTAAADEGDADASGGSDERSEAEGTES
jgi:large subunit ribosomal protein L22